MRVIFVPVADRPECAKALRTAFDLGAHLGASISGCHIRPHRESAINLPTELASLGEINADWESVSKSKSSNKKNHKAAEALFSKVADSNNYPITKKAKAIPSAIWIEKVGSPVKVMSIMGPVSDLLIVSRPKTKSSKIAQAFMHAALMNSSRPVLILPQTGKHSVGQRISIAWNQSTEAANAVAAAMPLLQRAEQVNIITCDSETGLGPKSGHLADYLAAWGVKTKTYRAKGPDNGKALVNAYQDTKSDLLVMGAYSRSRLRQKIFGGVTDFMLHRANIPVLMLHS